MLKKKGDSKMQVSLWKLLKTNVEKMSTFWSVWMLMKNKLLIGILCGY
jgi:hypothetical protein